jgi:hypothetical protein
MGHGHSQVEHPMLEWVNTSTRHLATMAAIKIVVKVEQGQIHGMIVARMMSIWARKILQVSTATLRRILQQPRKESIRTKAVMLLILVETVENSLLFNGLQLIRLREAVGSTEAADMGSRGVSMEILLTGVPSTQELGHRKGIGMVMLTWTDLMEPVKVGRNHGSTGIMATSTWVDLMKLVEVVGNHDGI